jgi:prepilin peptidase CpaA
VSPTFDTLSITAFGGLLLFAAVKDIRHRRIPNIACIGIVVLGVTVSLVTKGTDGLISSVIGMALGLIVLLPVYALGRIGAGDVKLLAACGAFLGPVNLINGTILAFLIGGLLAFYYIAANRLTYLIPRMYAFLPHSSTSHKRIELPYGVAISGGALLALWLTPVQFEILGLN